MHTTNTLLFVTICLFGAAFAVDNTIFDSSPVEIKQALAEKMRANHLNKLNEYASAMYAESLADSMKADHVDRIMDLISNRAQSKRDSNFQNFLTGTGKNYDIFNDMTLIRTRELKKQLREMMAATSFDRSFTQTFQSSVSRINPIEAVFYTLSVSERAEFIHRLFESSFGTTAFADDTEFANVFRFQPVHYVLDKNAEFSKVQSVAGSVVPLRELITRSSPSSFIVSYNTTKDMSFKIDRKTTFPASLATMGTLASTADKYFGDFSSSGFDLSDASSRLFPQISSRFPIEMSIISPVMDFSKLGEGDEFGLFRYNPSSFKFERVFSFFDQASSRIFSTYSGFNDQVFGSYAFAVVKKVSIKTGSVEAEM